jgi:hypothetical protein
MKRKGRATGATTQFTAELDVVIGKEISDLQTRDILPSTLNRLKPNI